VVEVDVLPPQTGDIAAAQAAQGDQPPQREHTAGIWLLGGCSNVLHFGRIGRDVRDVP
jgi:hypothetical protein